MSLLKKKSKKTVTASPVITSEPPVRRESPFSSDMIDIVVNSATLHVHRAVVQRAPKLFSHFKQPLDPFGFTSQTGCLTANLITASVDVGHVLVQWLYSGEYELHEQTTPPSPYEALKIAFGVYSLAREYSLAGLEVLYRDQITFLASKAGVLSFTDAIQDAYPRVVGHDSWLETYITTRMRAALENDENLVATHNEAEKEGKIAIVRLLVKGALDAYREIHEDVLKREKQSIPVAPDAGPGEGSQYELALEAVSENTLEMAGKCGSSPSPDKDD